MQKEITTAFKWMLIGKISNQFIGFVLTVILARLLFPEDFGLLAMIVAFSSLVSGFVNLGFSSAIIQAKQIDEKELSSVFYLNICIGLILAFIFFLSSSFIANFYNDSRLINISKVFSITFVINSLGLVSLALLEKELKFKQIMYINIISGFSSGIIGVILAFSGYGVWSILIQSLFNEFFKSILAIYFSKYIPLLYFKFQCLKKLWGFGAPLFLSGLINSIFSKIDYLIIGKFFPAALLGLLYRAKSFRTLIIRYTTESLGKVLFPVFSKKQDDIVWISNTVTLSLKLSFYLILFFSILLFTIGEEMFIILFSEKWLGAVPYFKILILSSVTFPMISILGNVLIGLGKSKRFLFLDSFEKIGLLIGIVLAVYKNNLLIYLYIDFIVRLVAVGIFYFRVDKILKLNKKEISVSFLSSIIIVLLSFYSVSFILSKLSIENIWLIIIFKGVIFTSFFYIFSEVDQRLQKKSNLHMIKSLITNYKS
jgi:teichuronic acid exporter